jgi:predicted acyltransferase
VLFALGLFLTNFPYFTPSTLRIPGVLQRIALCYFVAVLVFLEAPVWGQTAIMLTLLSVYWLLLMLVPVPGYGAGVLGKEGNLAAYVDTLVLKGHLLRKTSDPEGLLSTIPALATTLSGILAGHWLRTARREQEKMLGLFVAGMAAIVVGQVMSRWFPINKNLWTSSYVVFTSGMASVFLGTCYWLVDIKGYRRWALPFVAFGMNAISVYILAMLGACLLDLHWVVSPAGIPITLRAYICEVFFSSWAGPFNGSLGFALFYVGVWFVPMAALYYNGIFLKI